MLTKTNLRALSPGQWARIVVPDYECWQKLDGYRNPLVGKEVDICVIPYYQPRYDSEYFHWNYQCAYRRPSGGWSEFHDTEGSVISPWQFGLIDATSNSPNWDSETSSEHHQGKGKWLYEPASDDPKLCPGPDWSRYHCSICAKHVRPFSNDEGGLICPTCEATGLVVLDEHLLDHLEDIRTFARSMGLASQLERQLDFLASYGSKPGRQCMLSGDFAPYSFSFAQFALPHMTADGLRHFIFNGGLIYQGPHCPADGSFPSLTVSLASGTGWFCHT